MSVFIQQSSSIINQANSDVLFELSSSSPNSPLYPYISYIKDSGSNLLTQVTQQPNPYGWGVFNLGTILSQYLEVDTYVPKLGSIPGFAELFGLSTDLAKIFKLTFSEQSGSSISSSIVTSSIQVSGSTPYYLMLNGTINPDYGQWDFRYEDYYKPQTTPSVATFNFNVGLTEASRTQYCKIDDYLTVSFINGNITTSPTQAQDIYAFDLEVFHNGASVYQQNIFNVGSAVVYQGGPRSATNQLWSAVATNPTGGLALNRQSENTLLLHAAIGPKNITDTTLSYDFLTQPWDYYTVKFLAQEAPDTPNVNGVWDTFTIYKQTEACYYDGVRFIWLNDLGAYDYFNFTLAQSKTYNIDRGEYTKTFVDYSTKTNKVNYDISNRGITSYFTDINTEQTVSSNWLTQQQAEWLEQLFYSPRVFIQNGNNIIPVNITTTEVVTKTNPKSQKLFTYLVSFKPSNDKRSR